AEPCHRSPLSPCAWNGRTGRSTVAAETPFPARAAVVSRKGALMDRSTRPLALVTGASSGIGTALARELARHGHNLVLTARRVAPMEALAAELRALGAVATVIPADLSKPGAAVTLAHDIAERGLDIDILVNNAGLGALGRFDRMDPGRIGDMLQIN